MSLSLAQAAEAAHLAKVQADQLALAARSEQSKIEAQRAEAVSAKRRFLDSEPLRTHADLVFSGILGPEFPGPGADAWQPTDSTSVVTWIDGDNRLEFAAWTASAGDYRTTLLGARGLEEGDNARYTPLRTIADLGALLARLRENNE